MADPPAYASARSYPYNSDIGASPSSGAKESPYQGPIPIQLSVETGAGGSAAAQHSNSFAARAERDSPAGRRRRQEADGRLAFYDDPLSPVFQDLEAYSRSHSPHRRRTESVPDKSPLQRLEASLGEISKEDRRARVEEAEVSARQRSARQGYGASHATSTPVIMSHSRDESRRSTDQVDDGLLDAEHPEKGHLIFPGVPWDPNSTHQSESTLETRTHEAEISQSLQRSYEENQPDRGSPGLARGVPEHPNYSEPNTYRVEHGAAAESSRQRSADFPDSGKRSEDHGSGTRRTTSGAVHVPETGRRSSELHQRNAEPAYRQQRHEIPRKPMNNDARTTGNRDPNAVGTSQFALQNDRIGGARDVNVATRVQRDDPLSPQQAENRHASVPKYEVPPQTAAGQQAREQIGFGSHEPQGTASHGHRHFRGHLGDLFHHGEEGQPRQYHRATPLDEWRNAEIAHLSATELDLDQDVRSAWRQPSTSQDRVIDGAQHVTGFQPSLYLKCGPLLRYTGTKVDKTFLGGRLSPEKEIWRGTVMIVTTDSQSDTRKAPTLRLFAQPMDLMPVAPKDVEAESRHNLPSEYFDPVAGQTRVGRTGNTLFVKPVDWIEGGVDLSRVETDDGLFTTSPSRPASNKPHQRAKVSAASRLRGRDGEQLGKYREVKGVKLHQERGVTFWRFSLEVELGVQQVRIAYRINYGPAIGFWVPAKGQTMHIMFHSCNGFSASVDSNVLSGPDPLWRDVLSVHQSRPFHVMIGGGDQIYNDAVMRQTTLFAEWLTVKNPEKRYSQEFSDELQDELEQFYLDRYSMWFSQGLFGMANSQIPMVNLWDDHDIIDGFGSYPHHFMKTPVFSGIGNVAYKYYMLFQHQSVPDETTQEEPSWLLGASPGPYINELSRSIFMFMGRSVAFVALDCRTERMRDEILSQESYDIIFDRCRREIIKGETKHLIVLLGVPIAYPRLNFLENILTSRIMDPIKALSRTFGSGLVNKFDGGVEILDDLDDHWTAKHHKAERNWFIEELQALAAEKSVRITILGGDVHLAAVGRFFSNRKLGISKDHDHRYIPNVVSSAIVNTPPPELMADTINKRNKIHHLDDDTDEDMIPLFTHDVDGKARNNRHLLPRRNWCSITEYSGKSIIPPTPITKDTSRGERSPGSMRSVSGSGGKGPGNLIRRLSGKGRNLEASSQESDATGRPNPYVSQEGIDPRVDGLLVGRGQSVDTERGAESGYSLTSEGSHGESGQYGARPPQHPPHPNPLHRQATGMSMTAALQGDPDTDYENSDRNAANVLHGGPEINLAHALDIVLNCEVNQKDPAGVTTPYRFLVPALWYQGPNPEQLRKEQESADKKHRKGFLAGLSRRFSLSQREKQRPSTEERGERDYDNPSAQEHQMMDGKAAAHAKQPQSQGQHGRGTSNDYTGAGMNRSFEVPDQPKYRDESADVRRAPSQSQRSRMSIDTRNDGGSLVRRNNSEQDMIERERAEMRKMRGGLGSAPPTPQDPPRRSASLKSSGLLRRLSSRSNKQRAEVTRRPSNRLQKKNRAAESPYAHFEYKPYNVGLPDEELGRTYAARDPYESPETQYKTYEREPQIEGYGTMGRGVTALYDGPQTRASHFTTTPQTARVSQSRGTDREANDSPSYYYQGRRHSEPNNDWSSIQHRQQYHADRPHNTNTNENEDQSSNSDTEDYGRERNDVSPQSTRGCEGGKPQRYYSVSGRSGRWEETEHTRDNRSMAAQPRRGDGEQRHKIQGEPRKLSRTTSGRKSWQFWK